MMSETLQVHHLERYGHRLSIGGAPLFYFVMVGRQRGDRGDISGRWLTDQRWV
jgi:hypothetical protein